MLYEVITLPWSDLLAPAIALARDGFTVDAALAESLQGERRERMKKYPATRDLFCRITSYNVCYTKLLRCGVAELDQTDWLANKRSCISKNFPC